MLEDDSDIEDDSSVPSSIPPQTIEEYWDSWEEAQLRELSDDEWHDMRSSFLTGALSMLLLIRMQTEEKHQDFEEEIMGIIREHDQEGKDDCGDEQIPS